MALIILAACNQPGNSQPALVQLDPARIGHYGFGSVAKADEIAGWNIDIRPDGKGLPEGQGSVEDGEWIYEAQCAECHGSFGEGVGRFPVLAGGMDSLRDFRPTKTIGSYWPYTSTLYDYIYRAMPFTQPQSLSVDETYAVTAYVLYLNDLVGDDFELNQHNLANIPLPNRAGFTRDPRPDVANIRCMENCRDPAKIKILSETLPSVQQDYTSGIEPASTKANAGQSIYTQACKLCHESGLAGAPVHGEKDQWETRIAQGLDKLVSRAITGFTGDSGVMPPKGGFTQLSDEEIRLAVTYMVESVP